MAGVIYAFTFSPYDRHGWIGFRHLSARPTSLDPGQDPGLQSNASRGFKQRISIASLGASGSDDLRCLARRGIAVGTHARLTTCTQVLGYVSSPPDVVA
jgi:hypothetical protein